MSKQSISARPTDMKEENSFADNFVVHSPHCKKCDRSTKEIHNSIDNQALFLQDEQREEVTGAHDVKENASIRFELNNSIFDELSINCGDDTYTDAVLSKIPTIVSSNVSPVVQIDTSDSPLTSTEQSKQNKRNEVLLSVSSDLMSVNSNECRLSLASATSPNKTNEKICRICLESDNQGDLIAPCKCSGSTKYAHEQCLLQWFFKSSNKSCEVCLGNVNVRPMGYKPVQQWRLPERGCDFIVYLFGLYFIIMVIFTGMITWIATQRCSSPVCITLYAVCAVALIYFFYCCGCVEYSRRYWRSLVSVNRIWRIYGREDSHKGIKLTPKIPKKHLIAPIQTSETIRSNVEPFVININSEPSRQNIVPRLLIPVQENQSSGTENPISVIEDEETS